MKAAQALEESYTAEQLAETERAKREEARLNAEIVVPEQASRERILINADAMKEQSIRIAQGEAAAKLAKMTAEGEGVKAILDGKAEGYRELIKACASSEQAASLLIVEKLKEVATIQAQAIQDLPIEKIFVWDSGNGGENSGLSGLGGRLMGTLPPMQALAKQVGLDLPEFLGKMTSESDKTETPATPPEK